MYCLDAAVMRVYRVGYTWILGGLSCLYIWSDQCFNFYSIICGCIGYIEVVWGERLT